MVPLTSNVLVRVLRESIELVRHKASNLPVKVRCLKIEEDSLKSADDGISELLQIDISPAEGAVGGRLPKVDTHKAFDSYKKLEFFEIQRNLYEVGGGFEEDSDSLPKPNVSIFLPVIQPPKEVVRVGERSPLSILVIDDDESVGKTVSNYLREIGESSNWVTKWSDASEALHGSNIQLVILDLTFEQIPLETMLKKIRSLVPDASIVVSSGTPPNSMQRVLLERFGVISFISKPIASGDIRSILVKALSGGKT